MWAALARATCGLIPALATLTLTLSKIMTLMTPTSGLAFSCTIAGPGPVVTPSLALHASNSSRLLLPMAICFQRDPLGKLTAGISLGPNIEVAWDATWVLFNLLIRGRTSLSITSLSLFPGFALTGR